MNQEKEKPLGKNNNTPNPLEITPQFVFPKKVCLVYSEVKREYFPTKAQYLTEKDAYGDAKIIAKHLKKININSLLFPANNKLPQKLRISKPKMIFNLVGSVRGKEYLSATIPALFELLQIPYTGSGMLGESLVYNKFLIKKLLEQNGIPVPRYQLFNTASDPLDFTLRFPLISKLNEIHGAVEITKDSVSENEKHLRERLKFLIKTYNQPILVEEFIVGREITCILLEGLNKKVYCAEKFYQNKTDKYVFSTFEDQWLTKEGEYRFVYQKYEEPQLKEYVRKAFEVCEMDDYGKFDIRLDNSGRYFFIDSNSNPAFGPKEVECALSTILNLYDIPFTDILKRLILNTIRDSKINFQD